MTTIVIDPPPLRPIPRVPFAIAPIGAKTHTTGEDLDGGTLHPHAAAEPLGLQW